MKAVMKIPPDRLPDHGKAVHVRHLYDDELHYLEIKGADKAWSAGKKRRSRHQGEEKNIRDLWSGQKQKPKS